MSTALAVATPDQAIPEPLPVEQQVKDMVSHLVNAIDNQDSTEHDITRNKIRRRQQISLHSNQRC